MTIRTDRLVVKLDQRLVTVDGNPVHLTPKEYEILELLSSRKGMILTKEMILNHLYGGMDEPEIKIIDVFVCKLRRKLTPGDRRGSLHRYHLGSRLRPPKSGDRVGDNRRGDRQRVAAHPHGWSPRPSHTPWYGTWLGSSASASKRLYAGQ